MSLTLLHGRGRPEHHCNRCKGKPPWILREGGEAKCGKHGTQIVVKLQGGGGPTIMYPFGAYVEHFRGRCATHKRDPMLTY